MKMKATLAIALPFLLPATLLPATTHAMNSDPQLIHAAWKPAVIFAGSGNKNNALQHWQQVRDIQAIMTENALVDQHSRQFANELWGSLEDFNLKKFHTLLPNVNGEWREFDMHGKRDGNMYRFYDTTPGKLPPEMLTLGETRLSMKSKRVENTPKSGSIFARGDHYLISNEWAIGWGSYNWQSFRDAVTSVTQLLYPAPTAADDAEVQAARAVINANNPRLDPQDVDILVPLQLGFPNLANSFSSYGAIRDVVVSDHLFLRKLDANGIQPKRVALTIAIDRHRLEDRYPAIYDYLHRVDNLVSLTLRIANPDGELISLRLDSTDLSLRIDTLVAGNSLIPTQAGVPQFDKPFQLGSTPHQFTAVADAFVDIFGVTTEIRGIQSEASYIPGNDGVQMSLRLNRIPKVKVHGSAFGFIPTALIDAVMPGNLDETILDFMKIATLGNDGNGIETAVTMKNTETPGITHVAINNSIEALDSRLVRLGMSVINKRLMPDEKQSLEFSSLVQSSSRAFQQDLAQYEALSRQQVAVRD